MAKILVIDDNDTNRKLVVTLLNFQAKPARWHPAKTRTVICLTS